MRKKVVADVRRCAGKRCKKYIVSYPGEKPSRYCGKCRMRKSRSHYPVQTRS